MSKENEHAEIFRQAAQRMSKEKAEENQINRALPPKKRDDTSFKFLVSALRFFAWVALIAGIIGGISLWVNLPDETSVIKAFRRQYIIGIIGSFMQGFVVWVLFSVVAMMAETLEDIKNEIFRKEQQK